MSTSSGSEPDAAAATTASSAGGGLGAITIATIVSGGIGYVILALVPRVIAEPAALLQFTTFWSVLYLLVASLSGLQQEVARATRAGGGEGTGALPRLTLSLAAATTALVAITSPIWTPLVAPRQPVAVAAALIVALVGYLGIASLSGVFYGLRLWKAVATTTIIDAALRLIAVGLALATSAGPAGVAWAVAAPFPVALAITWLLFRGRVQGRYTLDVSTRELVANTAKTLGGTVALGVLTSGLPFLLDLAPTTQPESVVAALIAVVNLTRAPLVIPFLALQGWLMVLFRDRPGDRTRLLWTMLGGLALLSLVLAGAAYLVEPAILGALWNNKYVVDGPTGAAIVLTASLTAAMCISGPAAIATKRHGHYLAGWVTAAAASVVLLFLPLPLVERALVAMAVGPLLGVSIHAWSLRRPSTSLLD